MAIWAVVVEEAPQFGWLRVKRADRGLNQSIPPRLSSPTPRGVLTLKVTAVAALVAASTVALTPTAVGRDVDKGPNFTPLEKRYNDVYPKARKRFGYKVVGRNVVRTGFTNRRIATQREIRESFLRMHRWLHPPVPAVATGTSYVAPVAGGPEAFVACESGGDWNAVNPSSGAYGRYQLMPGHFNAGGLCAGMGKDPAGQVSCANRVYEVQGSGAWAACGG